MSCTQHLELQMKRESLQNQQYKSEKMQGKHFEDEENSYVKMGLSIL